MHYLSEYEIQMVSDEEERPLVTRASSNERLEESSDQTLETKNITKPKQLANESASMGNFFSSPAIYLTAQMLFQAGSAVTLMRTLDFDKFAAIHSSHIGIKTADLPAHFLTFYFAYCFARDLIVLTMIAACQKDKKAE